MHTQRKRSLRAVAQITLLSTGLACFPWHLHAQGSRVPARVYVGEFQQTGSSPDFPDLNRFLSNFLRLRLNSITALSVGAPNEGSPCNSQLAQLPRTDESGTKTQYGLAGHFYTLSGSIDVHSPESGPGSEVLVSYQLSKSSGCGTQAILLSDSEKFSLGEALDRFTLIGDSLATTLKGDLAQRIPIDLYRITASGPGSDEVYVANQLTRYLQIRLSQVDDFRPQLVKVPTAGAQYSVKGEMAFSEEPGRGREVTARIRVIPADGKAYPLDPAPTAVVHNGSLDDLGDFALQAADSAVDWLVRVRLGREAGIDAVPVNALLKKAKDLLCLAPSDASGCSPQPDAALVALERIPQQELGSNGWVLMGGAQSALGNSSAAAASFDQGLSAAQASEPATRIPLLKLSADAWYAAEKYPSAAERYNQYFHLASSQQTAFPDDWAQMPGVCVKWARSLLLNNQGLEALHVLLEAYAALGSSPAMDEQLKSIVDGLRGKDLESAVTTLASATIIPAVPAITNVTAQAMTLLGNSFYYGTDVPQDYAKAYPLFERAAALGDGDAMDWMGVLIGKGQGVSQDYTLALAWFEKAQQAGSLKSLANLGAMYYYGWGVKQDYELARTWYEKAVAAGMPGGMVGLGYLYDEGNGVPKDRPKAIEWYKKAADLGNLQAMYNLGYDYEEGSADVPQNYTLARQWFEKAADAGDVDSMDKLAFIYFNGTGVAKDYQQVRMWCEKAADKNDPLATYNLGYLYSEGLGVTKDVQKARELYEKAAAAGNVSAMNNLGQVYELGTGVPRDYGKAREWYEKGAAGGHARAMNNLASLYERGLGVPRDIKQARVWYQKSAATGNDDAKAWLAAAHH